MHLHRRTERASCGLGEVLLTAILLTRGRAVVSCHVERPLDDRVWSRFAHLQTRTPGGFRIAALMRPPDRAAERRLFEHPRLRAYAIRELAGAQGVGETTWAAAASPQRPHIHPLYIARYV